MKKLTDKLTIEQRDKILDEFNVLFTDTLLPINPKLKRLFAQWLNENTEEEVVVGMDLICDCGLSDCIYR